MQTVTYPGPLTYPGAYTFPGGGQAMDALYLTVTFDRLSLTGSTVELTLKGDQ
jgi:hypothetical protein